MKFDKLPTPTEKTKTGNTLKAKLGRRKNYVNCLKTKGKRNVIVSSPTIARQGATVVIGLPEGAVTLTRVIYTSIDRKQ